MVLGVWDVPPGSWVTWVLKWPDLWHWKDRDRRLCQEPKCELKGREWGFPGGPVVEYPPASTGDTRLILGLGRIPPAAEELSPRASAAEPEPTRCDNHVPPRACALQPEMPPQ